MMTSIWHHHRNDVKVYIFWKYLGSFIIIPKSSVAACLNKILENYQIKITKFLDGSYVKANFSKDREVTEMSYKILCGYNQNEVIFVPKSTKKLAFFEKFFQLFS